MKLQHIKHFIIISFLALLSFVSCTSLVPEGASQAEVLYKEAQEYVNAKRYLLAQEKLNELRLQYRYSQYAIAAELLNADILYKQGHFSNAALAYITFKEMHPRHDKIAYVVWMVAESFYKQVPSTSDRDLTSAKDAMRYYIELIELYPDSEYRDEAMKKLRECQSMLEEKEKGIADFYFKTKSYDAAIYRYIDILDRFKDNGHLRKYALLKILQSDMALKNFENCVQHIDDYYNDFEVNFRKELLEIKKECQGKLQ